MASSDHADKALVSRYLRERCGVHCHDIPITGARVPDYVLEFPDATRVHAELKTLRDEPPSEKADWTIEHPEPGVQSAHRNDNAAARIGRHIKVAHGQLQAYPHPWCVLVLNRDRMVDRLDFLSAFSGVVEYMSEDGQLAMSETSPMRVALGDTRAFRYEIDLYLWIDVPTGHRLGVWWSTPAGEAIGRAHFESLAGTRWQDGIAQQEPG